MGLVHPGRSSPDAKLIVHLCASSVKVKNEWTHTSAVIYVFMILGIIEHGGNFTFEDYCLL